MEYDDPISGFLSTPETPKEPDDAISGFLTPTAPGPEQLKSQALDRVRAQVEKEGVGVGEGVKSYLGRQFVAPVRGMLTQGAYGYSKDRFNSDNFDEGDLRNIALFEREQGLDQSQPMAAKFAGAALSAPGEIAMLATNPLLSAGKIIGGSIAGKAAEEGKAPWDPEVVAKGSINAAAMLGVIKAVGPIAKAVFPNAQQSLAGRMATEAGMFPVASAASEAATYAAGVNTRYGAVQDLAEGKYGEFGLKLFGEVVLGAGLAAAHSGPEAGKKFADKFVAEVDANARKGLSPEQSLSKAAQTAKQATETAPKAKSVQNAPESTVPPKAPSADAPAPNAATVAKTGVEASPSGRRPAEAGFIDVREVIEGNGGYADKAADSIKQRVAEHIAKGGKVSVWSEGKEVPVTLENEMLRDKDGNPWGTTALAMGVKGTKNGVELKPIGEPAYAGPERRQSVRVEKPDQNGRHAILDAEGKDIGGIRVVERGDTLYVSEAAGDVGTGNWKGILRALGEQHPGAKQLEWIRTTGPNAGKKQTIPLGKAARGSGDAADAIRSAFPEAFAEKPVGPDPQQLKDLAGFLGVKGKTLEEIQNANATRLMRRGLSPENAKQATLKSTEAFFKALEPQAAPAPEAFDAKQAAKELIAAVDDGGLPTFISNRMKKIAGDLGVEIKGSDTAKDVVEKIRAATNPPAKTDLGELTPAEQERIDVAGRVALGVGGDPEPAMERARQNILADRAKKPGESERLMGIEVAKTDEQVVDGVRHERFKGSGEDVVRMTDVDSGKVIALWKGKPELVEARWNENIRKSKVGEADQITKENEQSVTAEQKALAKKRFDSLPEDVKSGKKLAAKYSWDELTAIARKIGLKDPNPPTGRVSGSPKEFFVRRILAKEGGAESLGIKPSASPKPPEPVVEKKPLTPAERLAAIRARQQGLAAKPNVAPREVKPIEDLDAPPEPLPPDKPVLTQAEQKLIDDRKAGMTLKQIGQREGVSREAIRQREAKILKKMGVEGESIAREHAADRAEEADAMLEKGDAALDEGFGRLVREIPDHDNVKKIDQIVSEFIKAAEDAKDHQKNEIAEAINSGSKSRVREGEAVGDKAFDDAVRSAREAGFNPAAGSKAVWAFHRTKSAFLKENFVRRSWGAKTLYDEIVDGGGINRESAKLTDSAILESGLPKQLFKAKGGQHLDTLVERYLGTQDSVGKQMRIARRSETENSKDQLLELIKKHTLVEEGQWGERDFARQAEAASMSAEQQEAIDWLSEPVESPAAKRDRLAEEAASRIRNQVYGMGAAGVGELLPPGAGPKKGNTALANAKIDAERAAEGLNPILASARMENSEAWDAAMKRLDVDPEAAKKLIDSLDRKPRAADVVEQAMLLREKIRLDNEYRILGKQLLKAPKEGADAIDLSALEARIEDLARQRTDLATAVRRTGTELGRSLQFRKQLAADDYSLAGMLQELSIATGREPTPEETKKIAALQAKIEELQGKLDLQEQENPGSRQKQTGSKAGLNPDLVELMKAKGEFQKMVEGGRQSQRGIGQKLSDLLIKIRQNMVISSPATMGKIVAASAERMAIAPLEEAVGAFWSRVPGLAKIAAKAPREGRGLSVKREIQATYDGLTEGMKDAWANLRHGESDLDVMHSREAKGPREWLDLQFGLHAAAKAPAVRAEYTRSFLGRVDAMAESGRDPTTPAALLEISGAAYRDSQTAKFQGDNRLVEAYNKFISHLRSKEASPSAQALGTGLKLLTPVVRIPTNLAREVATYAFGTATGSIQAGRAFARGLDNLKPAEADAIMQQFKKGSLGAAALLLGYFNPQQFGGYYSGKRDEKDVKAGAARLFGAEVPSWVLHNPLLEVIQMGATVRRASDKIYKGSEQGTAVGIGQGLAGWIEEFPFAREATEASKLLDSNAKVRGRAFGQLAKSFAVPQLFQWLAGKLDRAPNGEPVKRSPENTWQAIKTGIPWARQTVPAAR